MRRDLPTGTVTFLFTDIEGSTRLLHDLGAAAYAAALAEHRRVLRDAFAANAGVEVDTQGDAFFVAFPDAAGALGAAASAQASLTAGPIRVRMGIHTGTPHVTDEGYVGVDVHRAARIAACGHGGQVLVSADAAAVVGTADLRDLGLHRLKDLTAPEHIYQLGDGAFPPLSTLHQTNLPIAPTPFLGRQAELANVTALLARDETRSVTLTGPGGTGKTRLALQAAADAADGYPHGVWWVPLAALRDPRLVIETAATALGAKNGLAPHIGDKRMLLVFDNFEHLIDAAADIAELLAVCPNLKVVVTSRERLRIRGEHEYVVPPLVDSDAIALFVERAASPGLVGDPAVAAICRRLDRLPLAIELAAVRTKVLSPADILARLERALPLLTGGARDLPERQRTLRATIEWSYDLLSADERRVFATLAAFRGGWTLAAAEAIAFADVDTLLSLVDKSLVRRRDERFSMLETIREHAAERLAELPNADAVRRRHAEHFVKFAEERDRQMLDGDVEGAHGALAAEHDNLRAALDHLAACGETQVALRLASALWRFWNRSGHVTEGTRRMEQLLALDARPTNERARALAGAAGMAVLAGDTATARARASEALALCDKLGDDWGAAWARSYLTTAAAADRDWSAALPLAEEIVRAFRELGDEHTAALAVTLLAWICRELGELERSRALCQANIAHARSLGNRRVETMSLDRLAMLAIEEGRSADAVATLLGTYETHREVGDVIGSALVLARLARALLIGDRADAAAALLGKAAELCREAGLTPRSWAVVEAKMEETSAAARAQLGDRAFAEAAERGRSLSVDAAVALARERPA